MHRRRTDLPIYECKLQGCYICYYVCIMLILFNWPYTNKLINNVICNDIITRNNRENVTLK